MSDPFDAVRDFERDLCDYTGAPYAVAVNSCTMAILLACAYFRSRYDRFGIGLVSLPRFTYVGVPMSVIHAGLEVSWRDENWQGEYAIDPLPVWDSARRFTSDMFNTTRLYSTSQEGRSVATTAHVIRKAGLRVQCVSFHVSKILGHTQGGAILHNDGEELDGWLRKARFDGRTEGVPAAVDKFDMLGYHCYMSPDVATALRWKLSHLPRHKPDLPNSDYPDLSEFPIFRSKP